MEKVEPESPGFYSRIFLAPKKNGKLRLIIDLSRLNTLLDIQSFRMETANKVRQAIQPNDWAFSLDLTDAYLQVFTRLMVAIATYLQKRAIVLFPYLDDWLVRNQVRQEILRD